jgi:AmmeMemoRadiSam system protein A
MLTHDERRELLWIAREAIVSALEHRPAQRARVQHTSLMEPRGAFVTIRIGGQLRGCIGYIESTRPLAEVVSEVAVKAALDDPRFHPLTTPELEQSSLEISILSPLRRITSIEEIEVGTHGILLELGLRRGLLLPQVAVEYGWNRVEFLQATARKAGLDTDAWKQPEAKIFIFSAEIIDEVELAEGEGAV